MIIRYIFPFLLLIPQIYLFYRFRRWYRTVPSFPRILYLPVVGLFAVFNGALLSTLFIRVFSIQYTEWFIRWLVYPFLFWHSSTFVIAFAFLVGAFVKLPFKAVWQTLKHLPQTRARTVAFAAHPSVVHFDKARRQFLRNGMYGLTAATFGGTAYGMLIGKNGCDINEETILIPGLPHEWNGFSIGLVTDIHSSMYMRKPEMAEYVRRLNDLGTDIVVVGGDLVNGSPDEIYPLAEAFSNLKAPMGAFGVLGNHDFYSRSPDTIARVASEAGIHMLRDERISLTRNGTRLHLVGIDDVGSGNAAETKIRQAQGTIRSKGTQILLCHRPYFLEQAAALGVDLVLSGHTHGGQLVFGRIGNTAFTPAALASNYVWGHYRHDACQMYVSRGIGTVAVPVRINCPPELTRIVLRPA
jgi:uncharacterized protein